MASKGEDIESDVKEDMKRVDNELEAKIVAQMEYYFSDLNLNRDQFMKELLTKDNGWVPLETILTFNRLRALSDDKNVVINALRSQSKLLVISDCQTKVRRSPDRPLPDFDYQFLQELKERTVHLKGFPLDTQLDEIMAFCGRLGSVESIDMRRYLKSKDFKGSIFVVFKSKEEAKKVLNSEGLKYLDNDLLAENKY